MNASELNRKLIYCGRNDLEDYFINSPLNRYIYKSLLELRPKFNVETSILRFFNEVYYQCARIGYDSIPGVDVSKRYLKEEEEWLGSQPAAMLVFSIVWVILSMKQPHSFNEECFIEQLTPHIFSSDYKTTALDLREDFVRAKVDVPDRFVTLTCPIKEIPSRIDNDNKTYSRLKELMLSIMFSEEERLETSLNTWRKVTDNFSHSVIEKYVRLYTTPTDQEALLDRIQWACPRKERGKHEDFFYMLRNGIRNGLYKPSSDHGNYIFVFDKDNDPDEDYDRRFAEGLKRTEEAEILENATKYMEERDALAIQLAEMRKSHEQEMTLLKVKYESEIASMAQFLAATSPVKKEIASDDAPIETQTKELSLTISEMVEQVKELFDKSSAEQFCIMFYRLATKHGPINEEDAKLIDTILPAIRQREAHHQTINIPTAQQVNINPKEVVNHTKEE